MDNLKKPVWSEGTILTQQHFQQWDRFLTDRCFYQVKALSPFFWGIYHLDIDESALLNGRFRVRRCHVIFPQGTVVVYDSGVDGELCCTLHKRQSGITEVFICLPLNTRIQGLSGYDLEQEICGWKARYEEIDDQYDCQRVREVAFALPNLCLMDSCQAGDQYAQIKIAEVRYGCDGEYRLVETFIPPVVCLSASSALNALLGRIVEGLSAKVAVGIEQKLGDRTESFQLSQAGFIHFLLLHSINQFLPILSEFRRDRCIHPWALYKELVKLLGGLVIFIQADERMEIPAYDHGDLTSVFNTLEGRLNDVICQAMPLNVFRLNWVRQSDSLYLIDEIDLHLLEGHDFYLAVKVAEGDITWVNRFLQQVKIASQADIQAVIGSAVPAVHLRHIPRPPNSLPIKSGYEYFYLERLGAYWQRVMEEGNLALFISYAFMGAQFEILVIKE